MYLFSCFVTISKHALTEDINGNVIVSHTAMTICYLYLFQVEENRTSRVQCFTEQAASSVYMDSRSITLRVTLEPGRYALLPTTFQPGVTGRFLLRLFSHKHVKLR